MKKLILLILIVAVLGIFGFQNNYSESKKQKAKSQQPFSLALDWTPNTNHTGIYVALQKGWYKEQGLDVKVLPYSQVAADTLVYSNKADAGISSTENVVAGAATGSHVVSIAAIIAKNTSGIIVLEESGIKSPRDLDEKIYGGFGLPFEQAVISKVIQEDGGQGEFKNITLETGAMQALESKKIDFVWVFQGWDGIIAEQKGLKTKFFPITDYGIPDYYTPNIITGPAQLKNKKNELKKFMNATARGYEFARKNPKESAQILIDSVPPGTFPDKKLVFASQDFQSQVYAEKGRKWGLQTAQKWHDYPEFMRKNNAITDSKGGQVTKIDFESLYTNEFLEVSNQPN